MFYLDRLPTSSCLSTRSHIAQYPPRHLSATLINIMSKDQPSSAVKMDVTDFARDIVQKHQQSLVKSGTSSHRNSITQMQTQHSDRWHITKTQAHQALTEEQKTSVRIQLEAINRSQNPSMKQRKAILEELENLERCQKLNESVESHLNTDSNTPMDVGSTKYSSNHRDLTEAQRRMVEQQFNIRVNEHYKDNPNKKLNKTQKKSIRMELEEEVERFDRENPFTVFPLEDEDDGSATGSDDTIGETQSILRLQSNYLYELKDESQQQMSAPRAACQVNHNDDEEDAGPDSMPSNGKSLPIGTTTKRKAGSDAAPITQSVPKKIKSILSTAHERKSEPPKAMPKSDTTDLKPPQSATGVTLAPTGAWVNPTMKWAAKQEKKTQHARIG